VPKKRETPPPLVYIDSDVYLDLIVRSTDLHPDTNEQRGKAAHRLFAAVDEGSVRLAASSLVQAEVGCNGKARLDKKRVYDLLDGWWTSPDTTWAEVDRHIAREAARLTDGWHDKHAKGHRGFSAADAVHLAVAVDLGCQYLFTHDGGFPIGHTVEGVQVMRPAVVWQESLLIQASGE
jgi:predicted nucleic acid-binding protein